MADNCTFLLLLQHLSLLAILLLLIIVMEDFILECSLGESLLPQINGSAFLVGPLLGISANDHQGEK